MCKIGEDRIQYIEASPALRGVLAGLSDGNPYKRRTLSETKSAFKLIMKQCSSQTTFNF